MMSRRFQRVLLVMLTVLGAGSVLRPQQQRDATSSDASAHTLHVFVNRMQIPVLILNSSHTPAPPVAPKDFRVMIDGVGAVKPTRIRLEGDDPIGLTIMVDRSDREQELWKDLPNALDPLLKELAPQDRITLLAMDGCGARRWRGAGASG